MTVSPDARTPSADIHALAGSTPPGAAPTVQPFGIATARAAKVDPDAELIDLAGRVKRLAEWLTATAERVRVLSQQVRDEHPSVVETLGRSATTEEFKAHETALRTAEKQIGLPLLLKVRCRMSARLVRWTGQLVAAEPKTLVGLGAKADTISLVQETRRGDLLADDLAEAVERDTVRLTGTSATAGANPALLALVDEFRRIRQAVRTMEVASKGCDIDEMPGWMESCARLDDIVGALCAMRAEGVADLIVMARVVQSRWVQENHEFAADLGFSFASDALRVIGAEAASLPAPVQADNTDDASQPTDDADLLHRLAEIEAIHVQRQAFKTSGDDSEDPFYEAFWEASDALAAVPATTLRGLAAKGRAAQITKSYDVDLECRNAGSFTGLAASMMRDVAAMAQVASEASPSRKASIEDYAGLEFGAWDMSNYTPPSREDWAESYNPHGISLHFAAKLLAKDKSQLVSDIRTLSQQDDDIVENFLRSLDGSFAYFEAISKVIDVARFRFVAACSVVELEEEAADTDSRTARVA